MTVRLPWRIKKLPSGIPFVAGLVFLTSAILKIGQPGYLCSNPWDAANVAMIPVELALTYLLWKPERRELGALLGSATMAGAIALLTWAHVTGRDVRGCGCFGPIQMPYGGHMAVNGTLFLCCFLTLLASDGTGKSSRESQN